MKIYTGSGDGGFSKMFGKMNQPTRKDDPRFEAVGTLDELIAVIGLSLSQARRMGDEDIIETLTVIRDDLFNITSTVVSIICDMKMPSEIDESLPEQMEKRIDAITASLPELKGFVLPGGNELSSRLHLARTVARRAERAVISALNPSVDNPPTAATAVVLKYLNRLSDLLFVLARQADEHLGQLEDAP